MPRPVTSWVFPPPTCLPRPRGSIRPTATPAQSGAGAGFGRRGHRGARRCWNTNWRASPAGSMATRRSPCSTGRGGRARRALPITMRRPQSRAGTETLWLAWFRSAAQARDWDAAGRCWRGRAALAPGPRADLARSCSSRSNCDDDDRGAGDCWPQPAHLGRPSVCAGCAMPCAAASRAGRGRDRARCSAGRRRRCSGPMPRCAGGCWAIRAGSGSTGPTR